MRLVQAEIQHPGVPIQYKSVARPFLKWAGGKGQLLSELESRFPKELFEGKITKYFEPFAGGAAVFFLVVSKYNHKLHYAYLNDINSSLILAFKVIQREVKELISILESLDSVYQSMSLRDQEVYFYNIRDEYNGDKKQVDISSYNKRWVETAAKLIFLNKTCFNGLYRENRNGEFNVPFGRYKNPNVLDSDNLVRVSDVLQAVDVDSTDFMNFETKAGKDSFVYFDPPYRPISRTSNFTSYNGNVFNDEQQTRLADLFKRLDKRGAKVMLSNSDPKNENPTDNFFESAYNGYNITRVAANRMINCDATKRGAIRELIITNY